MSFDVAAYLEARDQERAEARDAAMAKLTLREQRLVREFAVMGYVHGNMATGRDVPKDSVTLRIVLDGLLSSTGRDNFPVFTAIADGALPLVADEMVERAARVLRPYDWGPDGTEFDRDATRELVRDALTAAFQDKEEPDA